MTIPWTHIIPIIATTIGLVVGDRVLHTNLKWYRIIIVVTLLELFAYFGVAYNVVVTSLSLLLILVVMFETKIPKAMMLAIIYALIKLAINAIFLYGFFM